MTDKRVHVKLSRDGDATITQVMDKIKELQEKHAAPADAEVAPQA